MWTLFSELRFAPENYRLCLGVHANSGTVHFWCEHNCTKSDFNDELIGQAWLTCYYRESRVLLNLCITVVTNRCIYCSVCHSVFGNESTFSKSEGQKLSKQPSVHFAVFCKFGPDNRVKCESILRGTSVFILTCFAWPVVLYIVLIWTIFVEALK